MPAAKKVGSQTVVVPAVKVDPVTHAQHLISCEKCPHKPRVTSEKEAEPMLTVTETQNRERTVKKWSVRVSKEFLKDIAMEEIALLLLHVAIYIIVALAAAFGWEWILRLHAG